MRAGACGDGQGLASTTFASTDNLALMTVTSGHCEAAGATLAVMVDEAVPTTNSRAHAGYHGCARHGAEKSIQSGSGHVCASAAQARGQRTWVVVGPWQTPAATLCSCTSVGLVTSAILALCCTIFVSWTK